MLVQSLFHSLLEKSLLAGFSTTSELGNYSLRLPVSYGSKIQTSHHLEINKYDTCEGKGDYGNNSEDLSKLLDSH